METINNTTGRYAVLVRSNGWIDRYARREPRPDIDRARIDAWIWGRDTPPAGETFPARSEAQEHAAYLDDRFGGQRYRFSVVEERLVPRWYLADPQDERERTRAVGSCEQI